MRTTRTIEQTRQRSASLLASLKPAMPPAMRRRRRNVEGGPGPHKINNNNKTPTKAKKPANTNIALNFH
jgi:hypothetical protein